MYGVTSGTVILIRLVFQSYYEIYLLLCTYTTTLDNLATFAIPTDWGDITKITDSGGVMNYTTSFSKIGTFTRTIEGTICSIMFGDGLLTNCSYWIYIQIL